MKLFRRCTHAATMLAACVQVSQAGINEWTAAGPPGANVAAIAYVDGAGTALALSNRFLYRTTNHGGSWTRVHTVLFGHVPLVAVNPANRNEAVAVLGAILRSTDAGATWTTVTNHPVPVTPNGNSPSSINWTRDGSAVWVGTSNGGAYQSTDAGATWTDRSPAGSSSAGIASRIEVDATDRNRIYLVTGNTIFVTANAGAQWTAIANNYLTWAPSRVQAGVVLATSNGTGAVIRSTDHGANFLPHSTAEPGVLDFAPSPAEMVYGFAYSGLLWASADHGATWTQRTQVPGQAATRIAIDPGDSNRLLVASISGVFASSDGGVSWAARSTGMQELPMRGLHARTVGSSGGEVFAVAYGLEPLFRRDTSGQWTGIAAAASPLLGDIIDIPSFAVAPDGTLFLGRYGHFGVSTNGGATWQRRGSLDVNGVLAVDPSNPLHLLVTDQFYNAARSIDGGVTWTNYPQGLFEGVIGFAFNDVSPGRVYALQRDGPFAPLYLSSDGAATWSPAGWGQFTTSRGASITHEPGSTDTVYVGLANGLFKTTNAGGTWTQLQPYTQPPAPPSISSIAFDTRRSSTLYVSTYNTYPSMRSVDSGATWEPLRVASAEGALYLDTVIVDPVNPARLIGEGGYGGLFELEIAPDLRLSTTSAAQVAGTSGATALTITNDGPYSATAARLTATLPGGHRLVFAADGRPHLRAQHHGIDL